MDHLQDIANYPEWLKTFFLAVLTFGSEDLTTIGAGILASQGSLHPFTAILGCFLGIFIGDGLLYLVGLTLGRKALKLPILRTMLPAEKVQQGTEWFRENGVTAVIVSRFIPGTRLPTYFAAGLLGAEMKYFLLASGIATAVWTPLLVFGAWFFGDWFQSILGKYEQYSWLGLILGFVLMFLILRIIMKLGDWKLRRRIHSRLFRIVRWEFWPVAIFYFPVLVYNLWLMVRYRRLSLPLVSNPGIDFSGYVGESKSQIMEAFQEPDRFLAKSLFIPENQPSKQTVEAIQAWMNAHHLAFPIILKPDVGQRGTGVKTVRNVKEIEQYFSIMKRAVQAQEYAPGPYEFGVFYVRVPGEEQGRIWGMTSKEFPFIVGDGKHNVEELILKLPSGLGRYHIYLKRFQDQLEDILGPGETLSLVSSGNHCLGTIFKDGTYLVTPELIERFDQISQSFDGFYMGRYDVRAANLEAFRKGVEFHIIELNGSAGEPGHIYDRRHSLWYAYKTLFQQYKFLWKIGHLNAAKGHRPASLFALLKSYAQFREMEKSYPKNE